MPEILGQVLLVIQIVYWSLMAARTLVGLCGDVARKKKQDR